MNQHIGCKSAIVADCPPSNIVHQVIILKKDGLFFLLDTLNLPINFLINGIVY